VVLQGSRRGWLKPKERGALTDFRFGAFLGPATCKQGALGRASADGPLGLDDGAISGVVEPSRMRGRAVERRGDAVVVERRASDERVRYRASAPRGTWAEKGTAHHGRAAAHRSSSRFIAHLAMPHAASCDGFLAPKDGYPPPRYSLGVRCSMRSRESCSEPS
jgi:hypothetical protein